MDPCNYAYLNLQENCVMVYVVIVYDIGVERQNEVREFLKRFLNHVQNSVFEGEIEMSKVVYIKKWLERKIDKSKDSVIIYVLRGKWCLQERHELGVKKELDFY